MPEAAVRLTSLSHGAGCACKLPASELHELLGELPRSGDPNLLVGLDTADDAAVYRLTDELALVSTADFFTPIVDDPYDFGRIAATNALSDVYAMGGRPITALNLVAFSLETLGGAVLREILRGGESICAEAGIPIAGGHSIDSVEPIYGLAAIGIVDPHNVKRNCGALAGDVLILGKPLGVGILSAALKSGRLDDAGYRAMIDTTVKLNRVGPDLAKLPGVHAMTDVTGFGLLGHLLEMCRGSGVGARLHMSEVPLLDNVLALAEAGVVTGASARNWASYGNDVRLAPHLEGAVRALLCDPQTSGGLLIACAESDAAEAIELFRRAGFAQASVIGQIEAGEPLVQAT